MSGLGGFLAEEASWTAAAIQAFRLRKVGAPDAASSPVCPIGEGSRCRRPCNRRQQGRLSDWSTRKAVHRLHLGLVCRNFGWNDRSIRAAFRNFKGPTYVYPGYRYEAWDELAALLGDLAPGNLTHCFRATGGSQAVDLALQAAMVHTGRRKLVSLEDSYHGNTIGGLSVGSGDRDTLPNLLGNCHRIKPPLTRRSADRVETLLKRRDVAALIMEPISINLGVLIPEKGFVERVAKLLPALREAHRR